jgi:hypothetical protein
MSTAQSVAPPRTTSGTTSLTSHRAITNKARLAGSADRASRDGPLTPVTDTNQAGPIYTTSRDSLVVDIRSSGSLCKNDQAAGEGCVKRVPRTSEPRDVGSGRRLPLAVEAPARYVHVRRRVIRPYSTPLGKAVWTTQASAVAALTERAATAALSVAGDAPAIMDHLTACLH